MILFLPILTKNMLINKNITQLFQKKGVMICTSATNKKFLFLFVTLIQKAVYEGCFDTLSSIRDTREDIYVSNIDL